MKKLDVRKEKKVVFNHSRTRAAKAKKARENFRDTDKVHVVKKTIRKYKRDHINNLAKRALEAQDRET